MPAEHPPIDGEQDVTGDFDVCVIGSGPAGALTTSVLVDSGLRVLLLEEGGRWPAGMTLAKAEKMWERAYVPAADGRLEPVGRPWTARAFGGGMTVFAGIFFRYRRVDFDARQHVAADAMDPRWPVSYDDLRGFYDEIERLVGVARAASADPCEPESDAPVMPPHPYSPPGAVLAEAGRSLGLKPFPTPLAINSKPYARRVACDRSTPCNGYVCPTGAKSNLAAVLLDPLRDSDLLTISTESKALRLTQTNPHRVDAVEWVNLKRRRRQFSRARCFVAAANAVQSSALLLRSVSRWSPTGLGNRGDLLGRGLSFKISGYAAGWVPVPRSLSETLAGPHSTVAFTDYYTDPFFPAGLGGILYEASPDDRRWIGGNMVLRVHYLAADQPCAENRVRLASTRDFLGIQRLIMDYRTHPLDELRLSSLADCAIRLLSVAGARDIEIQESGYQRGSSHLHGGCRAGRDPANSVVNENGRFHDLENLYVVDGGFFPFSGGVNPTFTILANALRISRQLARELTSSRS